MSNSKEDELLITDDLHTLRQGEIYTDPETGKKYKVHKTILPGRASQGPHGIGDPNDRSLRKIEADVIIPRRMNEQVERVECHPLYLQLVNCLRQKGSAVGLRGCQDALEEFNVCKLEKFQDPAYRAQVTNDYLSERSEVRRTGMTEKQRKLEEYRAWKRKQDGETS
ncbi:unnamed protein product, partial [Mesorhabditis belari]|uniref:COX assembly mitochondrial protein n=1 Tax=Mesorhabditis belari TaxID=2138241 RepID=A0AAF3EFM8_9BILA